MPAVVVLRVATVIIHPQHDKEKDRSEIGQRADDRAIDYLLQLFEGPTQEDDCVLGRSLSGVDVLLWLLSWGGMRCDVLACQILLQ